MSVSIIESSNDDADFADFADRALRARTQICPVRIQPPSPPTESSFFFGTTARDAPKLTERLIVPQTCEAGYETRPTEKNKRIDCRIGGMDRIEAPLGALRGRLFPKKTGLVAGTSQTSSNPGNPANPAIVSPCSCRY